MKKTCILLLALLCTSCSKPDKAPIKQEQAKDLLVLAQSYLKENLYTGVNDSGIEVAFENLIKQGDSVNKFDSDSNTSLILLSKTSNSQYFEKTASLGKILLENNAAIDFKNYKGQTALHNACANGNLPLALLLIKMNADVNIRDNSQYTPIVYAMMGDFVEIVQLLAVNKADLEWTDPTDSSTLLTLSELRGCKKTLNYLKPLK